MRTQSRGCMAAFASITESTRNESGEVASAESVPPIECADGRRAESSKQDCRRQYDRYVVE